MENAPQGSTPDPLPNDPSSRLFSMMLAVEKGLPIRFAIPKHFGSKKQYYRDVSLAEKLKMRRLAQQVNRSEAEAPPGGEPVEVPGLVRMSAYLEPERHAAVNRRTDALSLQKGRLVTANEYLNSLIWADLRSSQADVQRPVTPDDG